MSDFARAHADLPDALQRRDTRAIHVAQKAVKDATTDQLRREAKRERSRRPFWWPFRRRR